MLDFYASYSDMDALKIPMGKSLTHVIFEDILRKYFSESLRRSAVIFDLTLIEWISLLELLLLIQWIHKLSSQGKNIRVFFPYTSLIHGIDESTQGPLFEIHNLTPMYRRKMVNSFLFRLGVHDEIERLTKMAPIFYSDEKALRAEREAFDDYSDPFEASILRLTPFWGESNLQVTRELSNEKLRKILREHSCLDSIDSGMLAEVVIEELASNAVIHGINSLSQRDEIEHRCAWVSSRLVKSSWHAVDEAPNWLVPAYKALLGKHYVEVVICDTGIGIYQRLKDYTPPWFSQQTTSVKAVLDYAFDKFSSSVSNFRTELDTLPRGLFWVYDLVFQYGGLLAVRSGGYFMAYDFLNRDRQPRVLELFDNRGNCTDLGGTAIQILLPQLKGLFISSPQIEYRPPLTTPELFSVDPLVSDRYAADIDDYAKELAIELEKMCRGREEVPIIVDFTALDVEEPQDVYLMARMLRYVLYFENPNILWLLGPRYCDEIRIINNFITTGEVFLNGSRSLSHSSLNQAFRDISLHDRRVCPILFPTGEVFWLGANEAESKFLDGLWGAIVLEPQDFEENASTVLQLARANRHLISFQPGTSEFSPGLYSLRFGVTHCKDYLSKLLTEVAEKLINDSEGTLCTDGCYHLPHGQYSHQFVYLKPLFVKRHLLRRLARYLLTKLTLNKRLEGIDIVIGGTHSARRLIFALADELNAEPITIDRYVERLEDDDVSEMVAGKRVLIVSDVVSSGSFVSMIERKLNTLNCTIVAICSVCDLRIISTDQKGLNVTSLFSFPTDKYDMPDREPIYEVNPISLRPMIIKNERNRKEFTNLISTDQLVKYVNKSQAFAAAHILLGPTHYTYFVDTRSLLDKFAEYFFEVVKKDIIKELGKRNMADKQLILVTAEGSNAEIFFPQLIQKYFPGSLWVQVDRIRLSKEGIWQLDRLDPKYFPVSLMRNSVVLVWDDGSNTGGTIMQLLEIVSEFGALLILGYCLVNRLPENRSLFLTRIGKIGHCVDVVIRYVATIPITTYVKSNCPICNRPEFDYPPIDEIDNYWKRQDELSKLFSWNHISAKRIKFKSLALLKDRIPCGVEQFLSEGFRIRCILGKYDNRIGVTHEERIELVQLLKNSMSLSVICFIFNREPQLLESIIYFQIPNFQDDLFKEILEKVKTHTGDDLVNSLDILEFTASINPKIIFDHLDDFTKSVICSDKEWIALIARTMARDDITKVIELLEVLSAGIAKVSKDNQIGPFPRGLCNAALKWFMLERGRRAANNLHMAISELQTFYSISASQHDGAPEYGDPLHYIIDHIDLIQKDKDYSHKKNYNIYYQNWQESTVKAIETKLARNIRWIRDILKAELPASFFNYYFSRTIGFDHDYLELDKQLSMLGEIDSPIDILKDHGTSIVRRIKRLYRFLFDVKNSPIAEVVKKIPVYVEHHVNDKVKLNLPWIEIAGIKCDPDMPKKDIHGFMTSTLFKRILNEIFLNIRKHNFAIKHTGENIKGKYSGYNLGVKIKVDKDNIKITIRSDGPHRYDGSISSGIRTIMDYCQPFGAQYKIRNHDQWVESILTLKRW